MEPRQQWPRRSAWIFWIGLSITLAITLGLIGLIIWLVVTQNLAQLSVLVGLIASIVAILSAPLLFYFTIFKKPEKPQTPSHHQTLQTETPADASSIWNVPYRRNLYFTGREEVLHLLHERLNSAKTTALTQSQALSGLGGVGKTQIAVEYAYRYHAEYQGVLWVNAESRETIIASFLELASLLKLPEQQEADQNKIVSAVRRWLTMHDHWLLIFDNADDLTLAEEFFPASTTGSLLLTTRNQSIGTLAESLDIQTMAKEEGTLLVLRRAKLLAREQRLEQAKPEERALSEQIVQEMDGLPLALDQAAAYIEETRSTLASYLKAYQHRHVALLKERGNDPYKHNPVATTWSLNFEQIEHRDRAASDLLHILAFLAPHAVPEDLLIAGASKLGPSLVGIATDEALLDQAMRSLIRFSLVQRNPSLHLLSMHRLVQEVFRMRIAYKTRKAWAERTVRAVSEAFPVVDFSTWPQCERYLPHALACATLIDDFTFAFPEAARLLNETASYLEDRAQYPEAEPLYRRAVAIFEQTFGSNHPNTATVLTNLAGLYLKQGKYEQAEPFYLRSLGIDEKVYGLTHPEVAADLNNLALLYKIQGRYEQAESLYQRALAIFEQALGPNHPNTADSLNNLAVLYYNQGEYERAEPLHQRALAIREQTLGPNHPDTAQSLNNLAELYNRLGQYEQAESLYQRALAIMEKIPGPNHPTTQTVRANHAELLEKMKRTKK